MNDAIIHAKLLEAFHKRYGIIPDYESILECNYRRLIGPGDTVIDIGAHVGRHTSVFGEIVGPKGTVWAFELLPQQLMVLGALNLGASSLF
jgi:tRNA A58 N-methylase Trm61